MDPIKIQNELNSVYEQISKEYSDKIEHLTKTQFIEALKQALASGDFIRLVKKDSYGQQVIYIPYAEVDELRSKLKAKETLLNKIKVVIDQGYWDED